MEPLTRNLKPWILDFMEGGGNATYIRHHVGISRARDRERETRCMGVRN